jgi:hypothetical protein
VFNSGHAVNLVQNIADSEGRGRDVEEAIDLTGVGSGMVAYPWDGKQRQDSRIS